MYIHVDLLASRAPQMPVRGGQSGAGLIECSTANHPANIMDFRGFDSSVILSFRGGFLMSVGNFLESLSLAILVGIRLRQIIHIYIYIYIYI